MIYTKTGDNGTTSLVGGRRVKKYDQRVEAYGTVDELNAHIGMLATMMRDKSIDLEMAFDVREQFENCYKQLKTAQNKLFVIQTLLATEDEDTYNKLPQLDDNATDEMEAWIDDIDKRLHALKSFVIPGGTTISAQAHIARTVCRRAERQIVRLAEEENIEEKIKKYINRTSDYLFVISRFALILENKAENFWSAE
ncbi:MAG: cob(I)yrinic acid a,c-diamide adenosyltransferase [Bacteroidales bacterium]|nr:cob(I)yrinic acid a,c-diamide adenosyltransferase [Bacteroidales bacterium]